MDEISKAISLIIALPFIVLVLFLTGGFLLKALGFEPTEKKSTSGNIINYIIAIVVGLMVFYVLAMATGAVK